MGAAIELGIAILLPVAAGYAVLGALRLHRWWAARRPVLPGEPIERIGADLRRLRAELESIENSHAIPGKGLRCRAVQAAYVDVLTLACARLRVPPPTAPPGGAVSRVDIYRTEAALRARGLDVRGTAPA